jgi:hypothetical protein
MTTTWRDIADQLTAEQIEVLQDCEAGGFAPQPWFLHRARQFAVQNLDAMLWHE